MSGGRGASAVLPTAPPTAKTPASTAPRQSWFTPVLTSLNLSVYLHIFLVVVSL